MHDVIHNLCHLIVSLQMQTGDGLDRSNNILVSVLLQNMMDRYGTDQKAIQYNGNIVLVLIAWDYFTSKRNRQLPYIMEVKICRNLCFIEKNLYIRRFLLKRLFIWRWAGPTFFTKLLWKYNVFIWEVSQPT